MNLASTLYRRNMAIGSITDLGTLFLCYFLLTNLESAVCMTTVNAALYIAMVHVGALTSPRATCLTAAIFGYLANLETTQ